MSDQDETVHNSEADYRFLSLVMSLATAAWSQLGKIPHPATQKIEKDLQQAQVSIDFLRMLVNKTKGNLTEKEEELLKNAVTDLELNYVDEMKKPDDSAAPKIIVPDGAGKGPDIIRPN